jgi:flagellar basal body-associated protein FliL
MKKKTATMIIILIVIFILGILIWGLIGSSKAADIGTTCDFGIGEETALGEPGSALCWKWHRNELGQFGDNLDELFD